MKYVEIRANTKCPLGIKLVSIVENYERLCHEKDDIDDLQSMAFYARLRDFLENNFLVASKDWAHILSGRVFGFERLSEDRFVKSSEMISSVVLNQDSSTIERIKRANDFLWTSVELAIHIPRVDCRCSPGSVCLNIYKKVYS